MEEKSGREREETREAAREVARWTLWLPFPHRGRAEQRRAGGDRTWGGFVPLPEALFAETEYEIILTEIPEGVMAASAWLQEAEDRVPISGTARFYTDGVALDVRRGTLRVIGRHDFEYWPLPAGVMLILHW
jgi:hypothetical protein